MNANDHTSITIVYYDLSLSDENFLTDLKTFSSYYKGLIFNIKGWNMQHTIKYANAIVMSGYFLYHFTDNINLAILIPVQSYKIITLGDASCYAYLKIECINFTFLVRNTSNKGVHSRASFDDMLSEDDRTIPMILTGSVSAISQRFHKLQVADDEIIKYRVGENGSIAIKSLFSSLAYTLVTFSINKTIKLFYNIALASKRGESYLLCSPTKSMFNESTYYELDVEKCVSPVLYLVSDTGFTTKLYECTNTTISFKKLAAQVYTKIKNSLPYEYDENLTVKKFMEDAPTEITNIDCEGNNKYAIIVIKNFVAIYSLVI